MSTVSLREDQWNKIYPYLRSHPRAYAGKEADYRLFLEGVLWVTRSGAQWRLLPEKYGGAITGFGKICINILPMTPI